MAFTTGQLAALQEKKQSALRGTALFAEALSKLRLPCCCNQLQSANPKIDPPKTKKMNVNGRFEAADRRWLDSQVQDSIREQVEQEQERVWEEIGSSS